MLFCSLFLIGTTAAARDYRIIDMHGHGSWPQGNAQKELADELKEMNEGGVVLRVVALTSPENVAVWSGAPSESLMIGVMLPCPKNLAKPWFHCFPETEGLPDVTWLREQMAGKKVRALHELMFNYDGSLATDQKMKPYWALAAEFDVPVGVHTNTGPPAGRSLRRNPNCCPDFDEESGNPKYLRPVLESHPGLRIWLQHVGSDGNFESEIWMETLSLMKDYPNVYVDLSITNSKLPLELYEQTLLRIIKAGFGDRIMFGTDGVPVSEILERIDSISSVSEAQKHAILFDNAARFLRVRKDF